MLFKVYRFCTARIRLVTQNTGYPTPTTPTTTQPPPTTQFFPQLGFDEDLGLSNWGWVLMISGSASALRVLVYTGNPGCSYSATPGPKVVGTFVFRATATGTGFD